MTKESRIYAFGKNLIIDDSSPIKTRDQLLACKENRVVIHSALYHSLSYSAELDTGQPSAPTPAKPSPASSSGNGASFVSGLVVGSLLD